MKALAIALLFSVSTGIAAAKAKETDSKEKTKDKKSLFGSSKPKFQKESEVQSLPKDLKPNEGSGTNTFYTCTTSSGQTHDIGPGDFDNCKAQGGTPSAGVTTDKDRAKATKTGK